MDSSTTQHKLSPGFFFLCLGVFATLIASVISFLNLAFQTIEKQLPDALNASYVYGYDSYSYDGMRTAMATLIIVFPLYVVLMHFWRAHSRTVLSTADRIARKWMVYLILFFSALVTAVDLVTLVRYFISGEITSRFILKVLITLLVAVVVGTYYLFEMQSMSTQSKKVLWYAIGGGAIVLVSIVWSFFVMGSPMTQRELRLDERRVQDLQSIQQQVISFWQQKEALPQSLADLSSPLSGYMIPVDPEFQKGLRYEYAATSSTTFDLCATFSRPLPQGWQEYSSGMGMMPMYAGDGSVTSMPYQTVRNDSWSHDVGRTCFTRKIDPDMFPPVSKTIEK